jgi:DNA-directed RNA polymerase beta' subunit
MVHDIFAKIKPDDQFLLGSHPVHAPPKHLLIEVLPVPPLPDRPTAIFNNGNKKKSENPTTKRLWDIVKVNEALRTERRKLIKRKTLEYQLSLAGPDLLKVTGVADLGTTTDKLSVLEEDQHIYDTSEISTKVKSTITAVIRAEKAHKKALMQKEQNQVQLQLYNDKLKFTSFPRSGDSSISDQEWSDFSKFDAAFHESTRPLIDDLQYLIGSYFREDTPAPKNSKRLRGRAGGNSSIRQRLKGKMNFSFVSLIQIHLMILHYTNLRDCFVYDLTKKTGKRGLIRANIQARRNDHSMRGVITPNPDLDIDELGIPESKAKEVSIPEIVTNMNIEYLRRMVINGPEQFPGANYVSSDLTDADSDEEASLKMIDLRFIDRYEFAHSQLKPGMVVHRHIVTGDYIPFNRQPSLHKFSFMAHRVRIISGCTFEMNPAVCKAYNADFDGDAMVVHVAQTLGARIEARRLLRIELNLVTPQSSTPLIAPIQDTVLGLYLLSQSDIFMTEKQFRKYLGESIYLPVDGIGMSMPHMISRVDKGGKWVAWRKGLQLFSELLPQGFHHTKDSSLFHMYPKIKTVKNGDVNQLVDEWFDSEKPETIVLDAEMIRGIITKAIIGTSGSGLIHQMIQEYGNQCTVRFQSDVQRVVNHWLADYGFSVGPSDCVLPNEKAIVSMIKKGLEAIRNDPLLKIHTLGTTVYGNSDEDNSKSGGNCDVDCEEMEDAEDGEDVNVKGRKKKKRGREEEEDENEEDEEELKVDDEDKTQISINEPTNVSSMARRYRENISVANTEQQKLLFRKREQATLKILHKFSNFVGEKAMLQLKYWNRIGQIVDCGAKGNGYNLKQILSIIGQQEYQNARMSCENGRLTAHFPKLDMKIPKEWTRYVMNDPLIAQGFVEGCFGRRGLGIFEFYNHQKAGN